MADLGIAVVTLEDAEIEAHLRRATVFLDRFEATRADGAYRSVLEDIPRSAAFLSDGGALIAAFNRPAEVAFGLREGARLTDLPFEDGSFDHVLSWNVIYHGDEVVLRETIAEILATISPFRSGGPDLYAAFKLLPAATSYPGDANLCGSLAALFLPVWYEGYDRPSHVWQSSFAGVEPDQHLAAGRLYQPVE